MTGRADPNAPIFTATWDFTVWVQRQVGEQPQALAKSLTQESLVLLDAVVFALKDIDRPDNLELADDQLIRLRMRVRLAADIALLAGHQAEYLLGLLDDIGRQLGGWQKRLDRS